ncbi:polysaccharide pyruvyl transferase family protein [Aurantiacibacter sp. MUD11]|uniref:polysaccharide pyruvyl transferase family protein n=1 Tax=Aurantiacibacter sp. MUD11 TaxID=3003265 RepID=UPI0022AA361E|nr:polysaccharide pyruvyl transferase family protein [Aurantiacibacter sp. MUD11]WAT17573.1 polysaccharide pyruvyl transferase family protein [Aurantiacibacter sp. MUD11]
MRIGILTFHYSANFGANLQTLATYNCIKALGHEPVVLDYRDPAKVENIGDLLTAAQAQQHADFIETYFQTSPRFTEEEPLADYIRQNCAAVIVGSDAVFRLGQGLNPKRIINRLLGRGQTFAGFTHDTKVPPYFLNWERDGQLPVKASLSPSSRLTDYRFLRPVVKRTIGKSLTDFDIISTRDKWTAELVRKATKGRKQAEVRADPLFVLERHFDLPPLPAERGDLSNKVLITGGFPKAWIADLQAALKDRGMGLVSLPNPGKQFNHEGIDDNLTLPMSPVEWYQAIASAAGYIGPRIHAIIAAIAAKTPFICMDPLKDMEKAKSDAYYDLLLRAGGTERFFLEKDLVQQSPDTLLRLMFDSAETQASCDAFATEAADEVEDLLKRVIALAGERGAA